MRRFQCKIGKVSQIASDLILVDIDQNTDIEIEHVSEFKKRALRLMNGRKCYSIINYGAYSIPTAAAREKCAHSEASTGILGRALVVNDLGQMILAKHTLKRTKTAIPVKIFTELDKAKRWIEKLKSREIENQLVE